GDGEGGQVRGCDREARQRLLAAPQPQARESVRQGEDNLRQVQGDPRLQEGQQAVQVARPVTELRAEIEAAFGAAEVPPAETVLAERYRDAVDPGEMLAAYRG